MVFQNKRLTSVVIPDTVNNISYGAFKGNNLTRITFGKGLETIGEESFRQNKNLTEIAIPDSVKVIGRNAFRECRLTRIFLGKGLQTIRGNAFMENQIRLVTIPNSVILVENGAFGHNPVEVVVIPASLAKQTFKTERNLQGIYYPVVTTGLAGSWVGKVFGSDITRITLPAGMDEDSVKYNFGDSFVNFWISQNRAAGTYLKRGPIWTKLTVAEVDQLQREEQAAEDARIAEEKAREEARAVEIAYIKQAEQNRTPAFTQALGKSGFTVNERSDGTLEITGYTGKGKDIKIPAKIGEMVVTRIGAHAFRYRIAAGEITSITIPDTVTIIGYAAFANVDTDNNTGKSKLTTVTWGKGLKTIEEYAFLGNATLKTINAGTTNSQTSIADDAFFLDDSGVLFLNAWNSLGNKPKKFTKSGSAWK